jgi:hypothetical protein
MKACRRSRSITPLIQNLGFMWRCVDITHQWLYPLEKILVSIEQEAGWAPELICMLLEKRSCL